METNIASFLLIFNCANAHKSNWSGLFSEKGAQAAFASPFDAGRVTLLDIPGGKIKTHTFLIAYFPDRAERN